VDAALLHHLCRLHRNSGAIVALLDRNSGDCTPIAVQAVQAPQMEKEAAWLTLPRRWHSIS